MTQTIDDTKGQVSADAAQIYEEFFVPALFGQWAAPVADAARIGPGDRVLDIACGTGVLAREALARVGPEGSVTALDCNDGMLRVARQAAPSIQVRDGTAEALPFDDGAFDAAVGQFGLMFFDDRAGALREQRRVVRPGGRIAVAVCGALDDAPGYVTLVRLLERLFGRRVADELRAPFALGDAEVLGELFSRAGIEDAVVDTRIGTARFASVRAWMHTDVRGWTLGEMIDDEQYERLVTEAERQLVEFVGPDGAVAFDFPAHIVSATVPPR